MRLLQLAEWDEDYVEGNVFTMLLKIGLNRAFSIALWSFDGVAELMYTERKDLVETFRFSEGKREYGREREVFPIDIQRKHFEVSTVFLRI